MVYTVLARRADAQDSAAMLAQLLLKVEPNKFQEAYFADGLDDWIAAPVGEEALRFSALEKFLKGG